MAIRNLLVISLLVCSLIGTSRGAGKEKLFTDLQHTLAVTAKPSRQGVLDPGKDKVSVTWRLNSTAAPGSDSDYKTVAVKLCYAPVSQVDRPWRKTSNELFKDKTCPHNIVSRPYDGTPQSFDWTIERDIPTASYFVRAYALDSKGEKAAYGQSTDASKSANLFSVQAISGRHASLDIASICFSVFSVVALFGFFANEKRKAKLEQSK
ncbi:PREDICTED: high-affinity nitrate transporter 3.1 [Tarenaya hassleriana]|uniref:high-affinity nitrate transporter 3.1 n=1 Tax=Tarenaya hassleriana TaxID=28532 RepID=UPI00053C516D|nr:PREDICTED: high-affinity nitrate transporter 3.1 [Tarenaya hassleriana]